LGGDISQSLSTQAGVVYSLTFDAAADLFFGSYANINLDLNGIVSKTFSTTPHTYNAQINRYDQMQWQSFSTEFTATSTTTLLEFDDVNTYDFGLDLVSVVPVPEPDIMPLSLFFLILTLIWRRWRHKDGNTSPNALHIT